MPALGSATARTPRIRGAGADRAEVTAPIAGYLLSILTGATTSSLGVPTLREDPDHPLGTMWGSPLAIRSDEYLSQVPLELGTLASGTPPHAALSQAPDIIYQLPSGSPLESALFFDGLLLRWGQWLPQPQLFAANRNLPWLMLLLTLPPLLRRLGANRATSWLGVILVALSPASVWWSFMPVRILAFASAGCYLLVLARDRVGAATTRRQRMLAFLMAAAAGLLLARLASYYVPWSVTIGLPLVLATGIWLINRPDARHGWQVVAVGALVGGLLLGGTWLENLSALQAELNTVYPGQRRAGAQAQPLYLLFGAPGLFQMRGKGTVLLNPSENATAFTLTVAWSLVLALGLRRRSLDPQVMRVVTVLGGSLVVLMAWISLSWGEIGPRVPVLNVVMPIRVAQTIGIPAALLTAILLAQAQRNPRLSSILSALAGAAVTGAGLIDLTRAIPEQGRRMIVIITLVTGVLVWVATRWPARAAGALLVGGCCAVTGLPINPVVFGFGDLRESTTAQWARALADRSRAENSVVATDSLSLNALLVANGVPSASGYQVTGPERAHWLAIDPDASDEFAWNRGASYLYFQFHRGGTEVTNPVMDNIRVELDPCSSDARSLRIGTIVAKQPLDFPCLAPQQPIIWGGAALHVYRVLR